MSVLLDGTGHPAGGSRQRGRRLHSQDSRRFRRQPVKIGIVNNMPDSALIATERQFARLVREAAHGPVDIRLFHLPGVPRGEEAQRLLAQRYQPAAKLFETPIDALIVTGNEPRAPRLDEEPYWPELTQIIDWARGNTRATLWSCLAAHAAVLHLDGIERRRLAQKKSGVLGCRVNNPPLHRLPAALSVCHSRLNEVPKDELLAHGYEVVSEAAGGHVDIFTKHFGSHFLFLQGHPEYASDSLMREYRRDVGRFLNGLRDDYPQIPEHYFDTETVLRMENYRTLAERSRDFRLFADFPATAIQSGIEDGMARSAAAIFESWMAKAAAITEAA